MLNPPASVEKTDSLQSKVALCPSCGMVAADAPHATSSQCIAALEAEIRRLSELVERAKKHAAARKTNSK